MVIGIIFLLPVMAVSKLRGGAQQIVRAVRGIFLCIFAQEPGNIIYIPFFFVVHGMVQHPFINLMRGNVPLLCSPLRREIRRLYLDGNFYVILLGALICVPLAKWSMDLVYPYCIANVAIGMDLKFTPQIYSMIYGGILLCYMVINFLLVGRLNKLVPAEVLKNRE